MTGLTLLQASPTDKASAMDTWRCVSQCFDIVRDYPLEIYHSALDEVISLRFYDFRQRFQDTHIGVVSTLPTAVGAVEPTGVDGVRADECVVVVICRRTDIGRRGAGLTREKSSGRHERDESEKSETAEVDEHL